MKEHVFSASETEINFVDAPGPDAPHPDVQGPDSSGHDEPAPLVMVHGVTRRWQTYLPLFGSLAVRRRIYAFDWRGHGKSSRTAGRYHVNDYVTDLVDFVEQKVGRPVVLYGHSLGAMVVAAAAGQLGDRVVAVLMEDPPLHAMGRRISHTALLDLFRAMHRAAQSDEDITAITAMLAESTLIDPRTSQASRLGDLRDGASLRFSASCLRQLDPAVLEPVVAGRWLEGYDVDSVFEQLHQPSLLLQADPQAGGMLVDEEAEIAERRAANCTRVRLTGCSHNIHWDRPADVLNYVHTFLETL